jgi:hypothetical protein
MMTYEYDPDENVIHLRASGVLVKDDPIGYFKALDDDTSLKPAAEERVYFQDLEDIAFTYKDIEEISAAFVRCRHGDKLSNTVFWVDSDFTFGMARMIIAIFGAIGHDFSIGRIGEGTVHD